MGINEGYGRGIIFRATLYICDAELSCFFGFRKFTASMGFTFANIVTLHQWNISHVGQITI